MKQRLLAGMTATLMMVGCLSACQEQEVQVEEDGFTLSVSLVGTPERLDPIYATDGTSQSVLLHLYEPLMKTTVDEDGSMQVVEGLAKRVDIETHLDGTATYTFALRQAKWSDGTAVTAHDFVYAWQRLASPASFSPNAALLSMVAGYDTVQNTGDVSALGVLAVDDTTFQVTLDGGFDWFLEEVCTSPATVPLRQDVVVALKSQANATNEADPDAGATWSSSFEDLVTCGAYVVTSTGEDTLTLTQQSTYYERISGSESIVFQFVDEPQTGWDAFQAGEVDFTYPLPEDALADAIAQEDANNLLPLLETSTVLVNHEHWLLSQASVRQALDLALDRQTLAQAESVSAQAADGLVPAGIMESEESSFRADSTLIDHDAAGVRVRLSQGQAILADLGYVDDSANPLELLYQEGSSNAEIATLLCQQWATLGVSVVAVAQDYTTYIQSLYDGTYDLALSTVNPTAKDAGFYLTPFVSTNPQNVLRYENSAYDTLLGIAFSAEDHSGRIGCLHDAESLLLGDYALFPLYTHTQAWALDDAYSGLISDGRGWFLFSNITD